MRIGHGYDVHRFIDGDFIILGGVKIPYNKQFLAHSDGDVLVHAICDSLLGAAGLRDIGYYFPDNDNTFKNINSMVLLGNVKKLLDENSFSIVNIDCTIVAQEPKMSTHIMNMRKKLAETLSLSIQDVNVKATTEERLGFTGNCEGIAVHSVCLIKAKSEI